MSRQPPLGVVTPKFWGFTASAMAKHLEVVIAAKAIKPERLQRGVYLHAKGFLHDCLQAAPDARPKNPVSTLANYKIAADAVLNCATPALTSNAEILERIRQYAELFERLGEPSSLPLAEADLQTATELKNVFTEIARAGDEEVYVNFMRRSCGHIS